MKATKDQSQQALPLQMGDDWWTTVLAPVYAQCNEERHYCQTARKEAAHWRDRSEELKEDLDCRHVQLSAETALRGQVSAAVALANHLAS